MKAFDMKDKTLFSVECGQVEPLEGSVYAAGDIPIIPILIPTSKPIKIVFEGQWQLDQKESPYDLEITRKLTPEQVDALFGPFERIGIWELDDTDEENYEEYVKRYVLE